MPVAIWWFFLLFFIQSSLNEDILETWLFSSGQQVSKVLEWEEEDRGKKKPEVEERKWKEHWKSKGRKIDIKSRRVTKAKLTTEISSLIKPKTSLVLFVCGKKLPFTSITDSVNLHNSAINFCLFIDFYKTNVCVQGKWKETKHNTLKSEGLRGKLKTKFGASVTSMQDGNHSLICAVLHL